MSAQIPIRPSDPVYTNPRVVAIAEQRHQVERLRDALDCSDPRGRHLSLAVTALEEAEMRLQRAEAIPLDPPSSEPHA